jgi:hypothetical protein
MRLRLIIASILTLALAGCEQAPQIIKPPYQRFVPVPREPNLTGLPWSGAFALDTKTGQLCWTYDIVNHTNNLWPNVPPCSSLFHQYPDKE